MIPVPTASDPRRLGGELKKHVAAVHMKASLSLLQRKVSNVLLLNAYEDLPDMARPEHEIRLQTLAEAAGFDSNDHELLREALEALVDVKIRWNVLDEQGDEQWGVSAFLAQAVISHGRCRYAYPPDLRRRLYNPSVFARINLAIQERFGSSYALALYENCVRYRRVGGTGWIAVERWRDLLGVGEGQYEQFKYLKRDVISPAVKEINRESDIRVSPEYRREKRRIVAIKFHVVDAPQQRLPFDGAPFDGVGGELASKRLPTPAELAPTADELFGPVMARLRGFGLSEKQALDLVRSYDAERIERNLAHVEAELARGRPISRVAAFALQAVRDDYAEAEPEVSPAPASARPERRPVAPPQSAPDEAGRWEAFETAWAALSATQRAALEQEAEARLEREVPFAYTLYRNALDEGLPPEKGSPVARTILRSYCHEALNRLDLATP
jgi:hypothetical protein